MLLIESEPGDLFITDSVEGQRTFRGGLECTELAGKEIMGKSSDRAGGGEDVAGVLEAGVPFPPAQIQTEGQHKRQRSHDKVKGQSVWT